MNVQEALDTGQRLRIAVRPFWTVFVAEAVGSEEIDLVQNVHLRGCIPSGHVPIRWVSIVGQTGNEILFRCSRTSLQHTGQQHG
jgi:hypothetical protein